MSARIIAATAARVLTQLRRDPRTLALIALVPCMLLTLLKFVLADDPRAFSRVGGPMVGLFPLIVMFMVTSITMLRERVSGTLERLMTLPLAKIDLLAGYGVAFASVASVQASIVGFVAFALLGVEANGPVVAVIALATANALLGMSLGLFASAFARTEFQAVQFMPALLLPQLLLCGLFVPRERMSAGLEALSEVLPMTYAYEALERVTVAGSLGARGRVDVAVTAGVIVLALLAAAATLRRRTA